MAYDDKPIVIAGGDKKHYLYVIGQRGLSQDIVKLHANDKYMDKVEYLLRILRKSFGWVEVERKKAETMNLRCKYEDYERKICDKCKQRQNIKKCTNPKIDTPGCTSEEQKLICKGYQPLFNNLMWVNEVVIEKLPQLR